MQSPNTPVASKRDQNRLLRRNTILAAARKILVSGGSDKFVIRTLAEEAQTTPRTIYAIFGSKEGVLRELYLEISALPETLAQETPQDLVQTLDSLDAAIGRIIDEAPLTRVLIYALQYAGLDNERIAMEEGITHSLSPILENCRLNGELQDLVSPHMLAQQIVLTFIQGMRRWSQHGMPDDALRPYTLFGIILLMMGAASPSARDVLTPILKQQQSEMVRFGLN